MLTNHILHSIILFSKAFGYKNTNCLRNRDKMFALNDMPLLSGYVKLGKRLDTPWKVKLHYGKARVFVKSKAPKQIKLKVRVK